MWIGNRRRARLIYLFSCLIASFPGLYAFILGSITYDLIPLIGLPLCGCTLSYLAVNLGEGKIVHIRV